MEVIEEEEEVDAEGEEGKSLANDYCETRKEQIECETFLAGARYSWFL